MPCQGLLGVVCKSKRNALLRSLLNAVHIKTIRLTKVLPLGVDGIILLKSLPGSYPSM